MNPGPSEYDFFQQWAGISLSFLVYKHKNMLNCVIKWDWQNSSVMQESITSKWLMLRKQRWLFVSETNASTNTRILNCKQDTNNFDLSFTLRLMPESTLDLTTSVLSLIKKKVITQLLAKCESFYIFLKSNVIPNTTLFDQMLKLGWPQLDFLISFSSAGRSTHGKKTAYA